ncbi:hypothetical protein ABC955_12710 [Citromicrobium bathyomarinum]
MNSAQFSVVNAIRRGLTSAPVGRLGGASIMGVKRAGCAIAALAMTSCSVGSDIPKTASFGESYAQATYFKGYENSGFSNASNQFYTKAYDDSCASLSGGAKFFSMTGSEKTVLLEANRRTIIYALTNNIRGGGFAAGVGPVYDTSVCANKVAFVPKPFGKYDVIQRRKNAGPCELEIIDKDTGSPPASFERLEYKVCVK